MLSPRWFVVPSLALSAWLAVSAAFGAQTQGYDADSFGWAQRTGKPIVVVGASWRPICRVQEAILSILEHRPKYAGLVVFLVDLDAQKDALWDLDARAPATLIAFRSDVETARAVGVTRLNSIAALVATTLRRSP